MSGRESWSRSEAEKATGRSKSELAGVVIPGTLGRTLWCEVGGGRSRFHNRRAGRQQAGRFAFSRRWCLGGLMWILARKSADIRAHFCREKFPSRSKNDAPGFATPHAPSDSGAQNE